MSKRVKVGDVLEIVCPDGVIYLHYLGKHSIYGYGVAVSPIVHSHTMPVHEDLFRNSYVTFYPVGTAISQGLARIVGSLPSPGLPHRMRRAGARSNTGQVETWIIEEPDGERLVRSLSKDERSLSISSVWNHEYLIESVLEGWTPEKAG